MPTLTDQAIAAAFKSSLGGNGLQDEMPDYHWLDGGVWISTLSGDNNPLNS